MKPLVIASLLTLSIGCAVAQGLRTQIETTYKELDKLMLARNVDGFAKKLRPQTTKNFQYVEGKTTMNFDRMIAGMKMGLGGMKKVDRARSRLVTLREEERTAIATIWSVTVGVAPGPDKKLRRIAFEGTSQNTYVKEGGKWKLAKLAWLNQRMVTNRRRNPIMAPQATVSR